MNETRLTHQKRRRSRNLLTFTLALVGMTACFDSALAEHGTIPNPSVQMPDAPRMPQLERAFWVCDYVATTRGLHATPAELCGAVTDELRNEKFGGSYPEMIAWWRQNKPVEHEKLASTLP